MTEPIEFSDQNRLELTSIQIRVIEAIKKNPKPEKYPLVNWYLGAIYAVKNIDNPDRFSQAAQSLRELLEKLPRSFAEMETGQSQHNFKNLRRELDQRLSSDKDRYESAWEGKEIDADLDGTICSVDKYLQLNKTPSRLEQVGNALNKIDPMSEILGQKINRQKQDRFHELWKDLEGVAHHKSSINDDYFRKLFDGIDRLIIDLLAPITAEDQDAILAILKKPQPKQEDAEKLLELIKRRGANYKYFFEKVDDPIWLDPLKQNGFFNNPPRLESPGDDQIVMPFWPPIFYLKKVSNRDPKQVVDIICNSVTTDNPRILSEIFSIACDLEDAELSLRLEPLINQYLKSPYRWGPESDLIIAILKKWGGSPGEGREAAHELIKYVSSFQKDPNDEEKRARYKENSGGLDTLLNPAPRFDQWEYERILRKGVRAVADFDPTTVALNLIDTVNAMIDQKTHENESGDEDFSQHWCIRLSENDNFQPNENDHFHIDEDKMLARTLTYACEQVYNKEPESIESLDKKLKNQRWRIFKRLRQHLYSLHLNDQTLPWIRKEILDHQDYSQWEHHYEFQLMIRKASKHFTDCLLSADKKKGIFDAILKGPSEEEYRKYLGERYSEGDFERRQRHFHHAQLRPFTPLLGGDIRQYFDELEADPQIKTINDDRYLPFGPITSGTTSWQSPKSTDDLDNLTDEEILTYLKDWDQEHRDKDNWLIEINFSALAGEFQTLFKETIVPDSKRLDFWIKNRDRIARPIYVAAILKVVIDLAKEKNLNNLDQWGEFCAWVLSHPDAERIEGEPAPQETSRDYPDWGRSRRAVVDFIDACVKDMDAPIATRKGFADLLHQACNQFDWRLDHDHPVLLGRDDPITEAINNTRSRALESLIHFGFWVRKHLPKDDLPEVTDILTKRMAKDAEFPLTGPEHALLGLHFRSLCAFNHDWVSQQLEFFFPRENESLWRNAFCSYIYYNGADKPMFEILRGEFEHAIENIDILAMGNDRNKEIIDRFGHHLFRYYLWGCYDLKDRTNLLKRFYEKTKNDRKHWGRLFEHVGIVLRNSGEQLDKSLTDLIEEFFDWRCEEKEPSELIKFSFWLEAECLDLEWRLRSYLKIINLTQDNSDDESGFQILTGIRTLKDLLPDHPRLVIKCLAKISEQINVDNRPSIPSSDMIHILKVGLASEDHQILEDAKNAQENFLSVGFITTEDLK